MTRAGPVAIATGKGSRLSALRIKMLKELEQRGYKAPNGIDAKGEEMVAVKKNDARRGCHLRRIAGQSATR